MAKYKNGFDTTSLAKFADQLETLGGSTAVKRAVEGGVKSTKQQVNQRVNTAISPGNLPAGGRYSTGGTKRHINQEMGVEWEGNIAKLKLGFDLEGDGLASIFLMYGTPHHDPVNGLREALEKDPRKISRKEMANACKKILERLG